VTESRRKESTPPGEGTRSVTKRRGKRREKASFATPGKKKKDASPRIAPREGGGLKRKPLISAKREKKRTILPANREPYTACIRKKWKEGKKERESGISDRDGVRNWGKGSRGRRGSRNRRDQKLAGRGGEPPS